MTNKFNGIIYLQDITRNRMTFLAPPNLSTFNELCGSAMKVALITTRWRGMPKHEGDNREMELCRKYWKQMIRHGSWVARFEDSQRSAWEIITSIIGAVPPMDQPSRRDKTNFVNSPIPIHSPNPRRANSSESRQKLATRRSKTVPPRFIRGEDDSNCIIS
jgi:hypothetical protein